MLTMNYMYERLRPHIGHHVVCSCYGDPRNPAEAAIKIAAEKRAQHLAEKNGL